MYLRLLLLVEEGIVFNYKFPLSIRVCSLSPSLSTIRVVWWHDSIGSRVRREQKLQSGAEAWRSHFFPGGIIEKGLPTDFRGG